MSPLCPPAAEGSRVHVFITIDCEGCQEFATTLRPARRRPVRLRLASKSRMDVRLLRMALLCLGHAAQYGARHLADAAVQLAIAKPRRVSQSGPECSTAHYVIESPTESHRIAWE